jgi:hypothetical protein
VFSGRACVEMKSLFNGCGRRRRRADGVSLPPEY